MALWLPWLVPAAVPLAFKVGGVQWWHVIHLAPGETWDCRSRLEQWSCSSLNQAAEITLESHCMPLSERCHPSMRWWLGKGAPCTQASLFLGGWWIPPKLLAFLGHSLGIFNEPFYPTPSSTSFLSLGHSQRAGHLCLCLSIGMWSGEGHGALSRSLFAHSHFLSFVLVGNTCG